MSFERYDGFDQDEKGIARGSGPEWFKDPAGNVLSVHKMGGRRRDRQGRRRDGARDRHPARSREGERPPGLEPAGALVLGHGAGGGVDVVAATRRRARGAIHRRAGRAALRGRRRSPLARPGSTRHGRRSSIASASSQDLPLVAGGRSLGARVACRTAPETGAVAVLCLAFPLHPPGRPEKSRQAELDAVEAPTLVVQGTSDPFGMPRGGVNREIVEVPGNHSLKADLDAVAAAVRDWLPRVAESR